MACARQIKRLDSITKSPIYAFFSETLNGTSSIRAYGQQPRFISHSDMLLDNSQRVWFEAFSSNRSIDQSIALLCPPCCNVLLMLCNLYLIIFCLAKGVAHVASVRARAWLTAGRRMGGQADGRPKPQPQRVRLWLVYMIINLVHCCKNL